MQRQYQAVFDGNANAWVVRDEWGQEVGVDLSFLVQEHAERFAELLSGRTS